MAVLEMIGITWVYGLNNITRDIEFMLNRKISFYWKFCWSFFIPVMLSFIFLYSLYTSEAKTFEGRPYPVIAHGKKLVKTLTNYLILLKVSLR